MKQSIWDKKIPTLFVLLLIIVGIGITSFLVQKGAIFIGRASPSEAPINMQVTNVSDTSFTISYTTADKVGGVVIYSSDNANLNQSTQDVRDKISGQLSPYTVHYFNVKNLQPKTQYYFSISSGQSSYLNNGNPFTVTTAGQIDPSLSEKNLAGKVSLPDGTPATEGIVYAKTSDSQTLSTLLNSTGAYNLSVSSLRKSDLSSYLDLSLTDTVINLLIVNNSLKSTIVASVSQLNAIPVITLSNNYDFTQSTTPIASGSAQSLFPDISVTESSSSKSLNPNITVPKVDQSFVDTQPLFRGVASPAATVNITIHSAEEIKSTITADNNGNWSFRPPTSLSPGQHSVTITTRDQFGILKTITKSFTVYAEGSQVNQSATPSATVIPTIAPTKSITPTIQPTVALSPTPTSAIIPTATATLPSPTPLTKGGIAAPGNSYVSLMFASIAILITGMVLFLVSRPKNPSV